MATTLLTLPTEIRLRILAHVLTVPSGRIRFQPETSKPVTFTIIEHVESRGRVPFISLDVLRTCKKIYAEGSGLFWRENIFVFQTGLFHMKPYTWCRDILHCFSSPVFSNIHHAQLEFDLTLTRNVLDASLFLRRFLRWAQTGNLKSIVFKTEAPSIYPERVLSMDEIMENFMEHLDNNIGGIGTVFHGVEKKFDMSSWLKKELASLSSNSLDLERAVHVMHTVIGGEMWVAGLLIWKDGVQIGQMQE